MARQRTQSAPHVSLVIDLPTMLRVTDVLAAFFLFSLSFALFCLSSAIPLLIHVPLLGALVRFRSIYTPKGLHIAKEGGLAPHVGPVVPNYLEMLLRIKRIEVSVVPAPAQHGWRFLRQRSHLFSTLGMVWFMEGVQCVSLHIAW